MALFVAALAIWFVIRVVEVLLLVFIAVLCAVYLSAITDLLERRFHLARWLGLTATLVREDGHEGEVFSLIGRINVYNILAACGTGLSYGIAPEVIASRGFGEFESCSLMPTHGRRTALRARNSCHDAATRELAGERTLRRSSHRH